MFRYRPVVTTHPTRFPLLFTAMTAMRTQYTRMFPPWFWQASMKQSQPGTKTTFASHCHTLWLGCLRELLLAAAAGKPVTDFKAGDSQNSLDTMCPAPELPQDNELIFLAGITTISDEVEPEPRVEPFSVRITSKFLDFPTAHHIRHELFPVTTGTRKLHAPHTPFLARFPPHTPPLQPRFFLEPPLYAFWVHSNGSGNSEI